MENQPPNNASIIGRLGSSYGIRGWLRIFSFTEEAESVFNYQPWYVKLAGQWQQLTVESWKYHNNDFIVKLKGYDDRDQVSVLTNLQIVVDAKQFPSLTDGEYYWKDLMGCSVITTEGYHLGEVSDMMETGSNDVLVVKANLKDAFGIKERLIPFLEHQTVKQVDLDKQQIVVDWDPKF